MTQPLVDEGVGQVADADDAVDNEPSRPGKRPRDEIRTPKMVMTMPMPAAIKIDTPAFTLRAVWL